jgi:hypothetical protein
VIERSDLGARRLWELIYLEQSFIRDSCSFRSHVPHTCAHTMGWPHLTIRGGGGGCKATHDDDGFAPVRQRNPRKQQRPAGSAQAVQQASREPCDGAVQLMELCFTDNEREELRLNAAPVPAAAGTESAGSVDALYDNVPAVVSPRRR